MRSSPKLDTAKIRAVVDVIRRMAGTVTWQRVEREVAHFVGHLYSRQALQAHSEIKQAYLDRKRGAPAADGRRLSADARSRLERERRRNAYIAELEAAVDELNERIFVLLANGVGHGVAKSMLEADLEFIDRARNGPRHRAAGSGRPDGRRVRR